MDKLLITVIYLTLNEEHHLAESLKTVLPWAQRVFIVDSYSNDRTVDIALEHGVGIVQRGFTNFGDQWNWALDNLPIETDWTLKLDPDERVTTPLRDEMATLMSSPTTHHGYAFRRRLWFMGKPMHQTQWVTRLWRTGRCRFSDVLVNEHPVVEGEVGRLHSTIEHLDSINLHEWVRKQNFYTTLTAIEMANRPKRDPDARLFGSSQQRRTFLKQVYYHLPFRYQLLYAYLLLGQLAIRDGATGMAWAKLRTMVYRLVEYKRKEMLTTGLVPVLPKMPHGEPDERITRSELQLRVLEKEKAQAGTAQPSHGKAHSFAGKTTDRIRLAVNAVSLAPGGGMTVLLGYLKAWHDMDSPLDVTVYASRQSVIDAIEKLGLNTDVRRYAYGRASSVRFYLQQTRLGTLLARDGAQVVLSTNAGLRHCALPQVVHHQNLYRLRHRTLWDFRKDLGQGLQRVAAEAVRDVAARRSLREAQANVYISQNLKDQMDLVQRARHGNGVVIYNGIDQSLLDAAASYQPTSLEKSFHIIAIQGSAVHKDNPTLLKAVAGVIQQRPSDPWRLTIAGDGSWDREKSMLREMGIADRVTFAGYLSTDQLDPIIRKSLCLVFPSWLEAFGIPPLEAMCRGCPVIAANATAIPEIVGDAALLVPPRNPEAFRDAILSLADNPELRRSLIGKGLERVQHFSWNNSADQMLKVIQNTVRETSP
ncbi:MAG: glycosyltransferase [Phycisphaera sp.]|nr:glycosyltransferase [Phycisphaera sp.]